MCVHAQLLICMWLFATAWTVANQAPLSMGFPRGEYWSGLRFPAPWDLPDPGTEPVSPHWPADSLPVNHQGSPTWMVGLTSKWILRKKKNFFLHWLANDHLVLLVFSGILLFLLNENLHILASEKPEKLVEDLYACLPLHPRFTDSQFLVGFFFSSSVCFFKVPWVTQIHPLIKNNWNRKWNLIWFFS